VRGWNNFAGHTPHKPFIDEVVIKCSFCQAEVKRIEDVGNPWLDAGIVPFSTLIDPKTKKISYLSDKQYFSQWFPQDFITESFPGQFKNWFYAMIAMATVLENTNPFERVLGYGTCLGEDGRPMHKSWGNYIPFDEGADKIGVDVMRLLFAKQNPKENLLFGYKKADEMRRQFYLILWNTYKFFVEYANLEKPLVGKERKKSLNLLDEWIWQRFLQTTNIMKTSFSRYDALTATEAAMVLVNDLSTWYIRRSRDRFWFNSDDQADKQSCYNTLYLILVNLRLFYSQCFFY
jgi:isoleucyl-tRNA synthetase